MGLKLLLNVQQDEYFIANSVSAGFRVSPEQLCPFFLNCSQIRTSEFDEHETKIEYPDNPNFSGGLIYLN